MPSSDRLAISKARASRSRASARRFMIVSLDISRRSDWHSSSYVVLPEVGDCHSNDTHIARFAARSQSCAAEISNARGYADSLICGAPPNIAGETGPVRLPIAPIVQTVDPRQ